MKKPLSNPSIAALIAVIVVISTILLQTRFRFGKICDDVNEQFYHDSRDRSSIASELGNLADAAEVLSGLAHLYDLDEAQEAMNTIGSLREHLRLESNDISVIHELYKTLLSETFTLESLLARQELNGTDVEIFSSAQHAAAEAKAAIDASEYHNTVRTFLKRYDRFPTSGLASLVGLKMPQVFS